MSEEIKLLLENLWNGGLSKQGKFKLEQNIKELVKQLQAYKDKEDKLREYMSDFNEEQMGADYYIMRDYYEDILQILDGSD